MQDYPGTEAALELSEAVLDHVGNSDLLKEIPVVGIAFKICRAVCGIRDRIYISKLKAFLLRLDQIPNDEQRKMLSDVLTDSKEREKVGERLLMVLEQITDYEKPDIMAVFFVSYLRKKIDLGLLLRCWDAIVGAYIDDLNSFLGRTSGSSTAVGGSPWEHLVRTGLTTFQGGVPTIRLVMSDFGHLFIRAYQDGIREV